ncbi:hypothetical protein BE221DRAFT_69302 [Ostreococcus tauri]|uniref:Uncharacterized protein n=1 Tax=Ostreococcus tauri TaxID=70448 RepID=A0A1Y5IG94_OSTTA|nr:hypothetical protein BE221DRAFT_69302 [Ostreococcus tauri]
MFRHSTSATLTVFIRSFSLTPGDVAHRSKTSDTPRSARSRSDSPTSRILPASLPLARAVRSRSP